MARQFLTNLDLSKNELQNARVHNLASAPSAPVAGQIYYHTVDETLYFYDGTSWIDTGSGGFTQEEIEDIVGAMVEAGVQTGIAVTYDDPEGAIDFVIDNLDALPAPTGDLSLATFKITNLGTPTNATDAATKGYVDTVFNGLSWKDAVRVATTTAGTIASDFENGDTVDGVTLATNDRILIKNQSSGEENGIYVVQATGAPVRASDAATAQDIVGAAAFVTEGTTNGNTAWVLVTDGITLGTTPLVFTQFGAGAVYTAGDALDLNGNEFNVVVDDVTIEVNGDNELEVKDGGIADGKLASTFTKKYAADVGNGSDTSIVITHNLGTRDVVVSLHDNSSPYEEVYAEVRKTSTTQVTLVFAVAPSSNQYRVSVVG